MNPCQKASEATADPFSPSWIFANPLHDLLPLARELGIVSKSDTEELVLARARAATYDVPDLPLGTRGVPADMARDVFWALLQGWWGIEIRRRDGDDVERSILVFANNITHAVGYLTALVHRSQSLKRTGFKGKQGVADAQREKVRLHAEPLRGRVSREEAIHQVAKAISRSESRVKVYLYELWPGNSWPRVPRRRSGS